MKPIRIIISTAKKITAHGIAELKATVPKLMFRLFQELVLPLRISVPPPLAVRLKLPPFTPAGFAKVRLSRLSTSMEESVAKTTWPS